MGIVRWCKALLKVDWVIMTVLNLTHNVHIMKVSRLRSEGCAA